jgi:hypothetical protein
MTNMTGSKLSIFSHPGKIVCLPEAPLRNMTSEGKQSNNGHKLFIIPKLHTQQNIFLN